MRFTFLTAINYLGGGGAIKIIYEILLKVDFFIPASRCYSFDISVAIS